MSVEVTHICDICGERQVRMNDSRDMQAVIFKWDSNYTAFSANQVCSPCRSYLQLRFDEALHERQANVDTS